MAEGEGFEPPEDLHPQRFSRPPQSTALPPLRTTESNSYRNLLCRELQNWHPIGTRIPDHRSASVLKAASIALAAASSLFSNRCAYIVSVMTGGAMPQAAAHRQDV